MVRQCQGIAAIQGDVAIVGARIATKGKPLLIWGSGVISRPLPKASRSLVFNKTFILGKFARKISVEFETVTASKNIEF